MLLSHGLLPQKWLVPRRWRPEPRELHRQNLEISELSSVLLNRLVSYFKPSVRSSTDEPLLDPDFLNMNNAIMACSNTTFTCGFYPDNCTVTAQTFKLTDANSLVLTATQLTSAMEDAGIATNTTDPTETPSGTVGVVTVTATGLVKPADPSLLFTTGQVVGVGAGIGIPMVLAIGLLSFLLVQEKKKHKVDEITEGGFRPPPTLETRGVNSWSAWTESTKAARSPTSASGVGMSNMHPGIVAE